MGIPTAVDRVIQQSIAQVLTPIYEKQFSANSTAARAIKKLDLGVNM
ncbi:hypothetical protein ACFTRD_00490 [Paenibacillus sp. NPDC056933]